MSINVNMRKIITWIIVGLVIAGSGFWWNSKKDERAAEAELETLIKFAQRQALEIVIIEQASKLTDYKWQIASQQKKVDAVIPNTPPTFVPVVVPPVVDPDNVE